MFESKSGDASDELQLAFNEVSSNDIVCFKKSGKLAIFVRFVYEVLHVNESKLMIWRMLVMLL